VRNLALVLVLTEPSQVKTLYACAYIDSQVHLQEEDCILLTAIEYLDSDLWSDSSELD
jgi:hypothetical protein